MEYVRRGWVQIRDEPEFRSVEFVHLRTALDRVEATYLIRLFAEFEAILQEHLAAVHPRLRIPRTAEALINRVALRERIPDPIRDAAQRVREERNALVHPSGQSGSAADFRRALAALNFFLARLPD
jgi:hypothetical protein